LGGSGMRNLNMGRPVAPAARPTAPATPQAATALPADVPHAPPTLVAPAKPQAAPAAATPIPTTTPTAPPAAAVPPAAQPAAGPNQSMKLTPEMIERLRMASARGQKLSIHEISKTPAQAPGAPAKPGAPAAPGAPARPGGPPRPGDTGGGDDEEEKKKAGVIGRDSRHKGRTGPGGRGGSAGGPRVDRGSVVIGSGGVEMVEQQWGSRRGPR